DACTTSLDDDRANCGSCGLACAGALGCSGGNCAQAAVQVVAAYQYSCAVAPPATGRVDGALWCWGSVPVGPTDREQRVTPYAMTHVPALRGLSLGDAHGCALRDKETITCFGLNGSYQLGVALGGIRTYEMTWTGVREVVSGASHSCARNAQGRVH